MDEPSYELVMPFLPVASRGGPYDDEAFTEGWRMGALDTTLDTAKPPVWEGAVQESCREQADLIAMKHGYSTQFTEHPDGWLWLTVTTLHPGEDTHG
jgi:hypothetical protein